MKTYSIFKQNNVLVENQLNLNENAVVKSIHNENEWKLIDYVFMHPKQQSDCVLYLYNVDMATGVQSEFKDLLIKDLQHIEERLTLQDLNNYVADVIIYENKIIVQMVQKSVNEFLEEISSGTSTPIEIKYQFKLEINEPQFIVKLNNVLDFKFMIETGLIHFKNLIKEVNMKNQELGLHSSTWNNTAFHLPLPLETEVMNIGLDFEHIKEVAILKPIEGKQQALICDLHFYICNISNTQMLLIEIVENPTTSTLFYVFEENDLCDNKLKDVLDQEFIIHKFNENHFYFTSNKIFTFNDSQLIVYHGLEELYSDLSIHFSSY